MKTYIVTIQIYKNKEKYTKATFEIEAKDKTLQNTVLLVC